VTHGAAHGAAPDAAAAQALDAGDPLACFAGEFHHPVDGAGRRLIYLCGHSLGLQPKSASQYVEQELKDWQRLGVLGHHVAGRPWIRYHEQAARRPAQSGVDRAIGIPVGSLRNRVAARVSRIE